MCVEVHARDICSGNFDLCDFFLGNIGVFPTWNRNSVNSAN